MKLNRRKPLTRMGLVKKYETLRICTAVGAGLLLCLIIILLQSDEPLKSVKFLLVGPFTRHNRTAQVLEKMQPMLITGCAFILMMSVGNFSLINTSCVAIGPCLICTDVILNEELFGQIPGEIGKIIWITACCVTAGLVSAVFSLIPPVLERFFDCDQVITSSLINSCCAFYIDRYVKAHLYDVESGIMASKPYPDQVRCTNLWHGSRLTTMFFVGIIVCFVTYLFLYRTRLGYAGRMVGSSPAFAHAAGINVPLTSLLVSAVAGALAGVAGTLNTLSFNQRFGGYTADISDGMFCGIFAKDNPLMLPLASFGLSYLRVTSETMANNTDIPVELLSVMTSFIIMMLAADQMFSKARDRAIKKNFAVTAEEREHFGFDAGLAGEEPHHRHH